MGPTVPEANAEAGRPALPVDGNGRGPAATAAKAAVAAIDITKRFPGVLANDGITFEALVGEVHALLGENGAGKTTLCSMLMGLYRPDAGEVRVGGLPVRFRSPRDAHEAGIFMVHQHLKLVESMTVAENVVLGWSRRRAFRFSPSQVEHEVAEVAAKFHMDVDPTARIWQLSLGERQRVEILKALYRGARILILDEPTTVLTPQESAQLFESLREMAAGGGTIIFISHKLPEVMALADRVTILRKGRTVRTLETSGSTAAALAEAMVGHHISEQSRRGRYAGGAPVLEISGVSARGDLGMEALHDVSLTISAGEVVGVAGVAGNGQRELAEVVTGIRPHTAGMVAVNGDELPSGDARAAIDRGVAYVPEDRMGTGVSPNRTIVDNLILKSYREPAMHVGPVIRRKQARARTRELMERFDIRAPSPDTLVHQLSGGNVQRVVLARELSSDPRVLVAASPTRGLDVGSTHDVRETILGSATAGAAVLLISEDLDEVLSLSDRVVVLYGGRIAGEARPSERTREEFGLMMAGAKP